MPASTAPLRSQFRFVAGPRLGGCRAAALFMVLLTPAVGRSDTVDELIAAQMTWLRIPGLSLAVVRDGAVVKANGYGFANLETETPATAETVYKIGSLSKQFLATAILMLAQDGKLALDDPAARFLPDLPETWKPITIRHLLTHTAGLTREIPGFDPFQPQSDAVALKAAAVVPLRFVPGEKWEYSNVGYYALAEIIRVVSGQPWSDFIGERIFAPAGMSATRTTTANVTLHRAMGYGSRGPTLLNAPDWPIVRPSGAFISTVLDLARWDRTLTADTVITAASRAMLWRPVTLNNGASHPYGFGWFVDTANGHRRIRHDGGLPGFVADFECFPEDRLTVIVLANRENRDLRDIALKVAGLYVPALLPPEEKPVADTDPTTTGLIKNIIASFATGTPDVRAFTVDLGRALAAEMNGGMTETLKNLGAMPAFELLERKADGAERHYRFRLGYRHVPLIVECTFNAENKIAKFTLHD